MNVKYSMLSLFIIALIVLSSLAQVPLVLSEDDTGTSEEQLTESSTNVKIEKLALLYINSSKRLLSYLNNLTVLVNITGTRIELLINNATILINKAMEAYNAGNYTEAYVYARRACVLLRLTYRELIRRSEALRERIRERIESVNKTGIARRLEALKLILLRFTQRFGPINETIREEISKLIKLALSGNITWGEARSQIAHIMNQLRKEYRRRVLEKLAERRVIGYLSRKFNITLKLLVKKGAFNITANMTLKNLYAYKSLIKHLNATIKHLKLLREKLVKLNASEDAIIALDNAIENLNVVLTSISSTFNETYIKEVIKQRIIEIAKDRLGKEIDELEKKLDELEQTLGENATSFIKSMLEHAKSLLESAKSDIENGRIEQARIKIRMVENIIRRIENFLHKGWKWQKGKR
ncbi:MAG: hypothetical protein DRZ82_06635 [Thermoprotei archaeon]|nr:MAG: hypothetical protein DRZ82_06635 [Thermoprotei archaeon]